MALVFQFDQRPIPVSFTTIRSSLSFLEFYSQKVCSFFPSTASKVLERLSHHPDLISTAPAEIRQRQIQTAQVMDVMSESGQSVVAQSDCVVFISRFAPRSSERESRIYVEQIISEIIQTSHIRPEEVVGVVVHQGVRHTQPLHGGPQSSTASSLEASARIAFASHHVATVFKES